MTDTGLSEILPGYNIFKDKILSNQDSLILHFLFPNWTLQNKFLRIILTG